MLNVTTTVKKTISCGSVDWGSHDMKVLRNSTRASRRGLRRWHGNGQTDANAKIQSIGNYSSNFDKSTANVQ
ncbi:hypothetical protein J2TS4_31900 [Paenibacillus sp. J2TS4]|nr:hypothetical protein J2TS4_31900 [Paenibacillus sp. J2TS4]